MSWTNHVWIHMNQQNAALAAFCLHNNISRIIAWNSQSTFHSQMQGKQPIGPVVTSSTGTVVHQALQETQNSVEHIISGVPRFTVRSLLMEQLLAKQSRRRYDF
jgi:hypothetical protein